jgi:hypothetical protein
MTRNNDDSAKFVQVSTGDAQTADEWLDEIKSEAHNLNQIRKYIDEDGDEIEEKYDETAEEYFYRMVDEKELISIDE